MKNEKKTRPITIENDWCLLFREYPEVYNAFTGADNRDNDYESDETSFIHTTFDLKGKDIVDIGSGTGASSFEFAKYAKSVIGVEPERSMLEIAEQKTMERGITNVTFVEGIGQNMPIDDNSVDIVTAITANIHPIETEIPTRARDQLLQIRHRYPDQCLFCTLHHMNRYRNGQR